MTKVNETNYQSITSKNVPAVPLYRVVNFYQEKNKSGKAVIDIVPSTWVNLTTEDEGMCRYPPYPYLNVGKMSSNRNPPGLTWADYPVRIIGKADSYNEGLSKVEKARKTLSASTDEDVVCPPRDHNTKAASLDAVPLFPSEEGKDESDQEVLCDADMDKDKMSQSSPEPQGSDEDILNAPRILLKNGGKRVSAKRPYASDSEASTSGSPMKMQKRTSWGTRQSRHGVNTAAKQDDEQEKTAAKGKGTRKTDAKGKGTEKTAAKAKGTEKTVAKDKGTDKNAVKDKGTDKTAVKNKGTDKAAVKDKGTDKTAVKNKGTGKTAVKDKETDKTAVKDKETDKTAVKDKETDKTGTESGVKTKPNVARHLFPRQSSADTSSELDLEEVLIKMEGRINEKIDRARRSNTHDIKKVLQEIQEVRVAVEKAGVGGTTRDVTEFKQKWSLPFKTLEKFQDFEDALENDQDEFNRLSKVINSFWVPVPKQMLHRSVHIIIERFLAKEVAIKYSAQGRGKLKKANFSLTQLYSALEGVIADLDADVTSKEIKSALGKVLAGVGDWDGGRKQRERVEDNATVRRNRNIHGDDGENSDGSGDDGENKGGDDDDGENSGEDDDDGENSGEDDDDGENSDDRDFIDDEAVED